MSYPKQIIKDYAEQKITRAQFTRQFADWQKVNGIDYTCKGFASNGRIWLLYRGIKGSIRNGAIYWSDAAGHEHLTKSVCDFKRRVDFAKTRAEKWTR